MLSHRVGAYLAVGHLQSLVSPQVYDTYLLIAIDLWRSDLILD